MAKNRKVGLVPVRAGDVPRRLLLELEDDLLRGRYAGGDGAAVGAIADRLLPGPRAADQPPPGDRRHGAGVRLPVADQAAVAGVQVRAPCRTRGLDSVPRSDHG